MVQGPTDPERDGVADYVRHLTAALQEAGEDVRPVPVVGPREAAERLHALAPDLVHVQFAPSAFGFSARPGLLPDLVRGLPMVTTLHEYGWWSAPRWLPGALWRPLERAGLWDRETWRFAPRSSALITTNAGHARVVQERFGRTAVRVPLAPNIADLCGTGSGGPADRDDTRRRLGVPVDAQVVAFFGFVHPVKGLRYLVEALARLRGAGRDRLHLLVLGGFTSLALPEGEARAFREELTAWTRTCGVAQHVTITGHRPAEEVSAALHAADIAAFPFTAGATTKSGALLSAFAHSLPTLVTAGDDPDPELVDGETVVVAPRVRDALVLVDGLTRLLDDEPLRRKVAAGGAALMAGRTWDEIAATHRAVYAEVLDSRRGRRWA
jgi:glycosyltransferase involved in cell wall biosynthesis